MNPMILLVLAGLAGVALVALGGGEEEFAPEPGPVVPPPEPRPGGGAQIFIVSGPIIR